jgi:hypothetical protein
MVLSDLREISATHFLLTSYAQLLPRALLSGVAWKETRKLIGNNYHVKYIVVSHQPGSWNFSENTVLSECLIVVQRTPEPHNKPTKVINLWTKPKSSVEALIIDRSLCLEKQVQTEFWQLHTWLCGSPRIRPVVIGERRTLKRIFIAERLPERHLGDEKPPVKSNFVFQHLAWCIDVWIPALKLIVERRFV